MNLSTENWGNGIKGRRKFYSLLLMLLLAGGNQLWANPLPAGPVQSMFGPGGELYSHEGFSRWESGKLHERYHVFEPTAPTLAKAGYVVLLHDWFANDPEYYLGLIRHLCRRGWVVFFPLYQGTGSLDRHWHTNVARSAKDFLQQAFIRAQVEIDRTKVVIIGHGAGGVLGANLAATSDYFGLPAPNALMVVMPHRRSLKLLDLSGISRDSKMVVITGDRVAETCEVTAREIFYAADRIKSDHKVFVTVLSDFYGQPPLVADEAAPLSPEKPEFARFIVENRYTFVKMFREKFHATTLRTDHIDAFDWFVLFRFFDALDQSASQNRSDLNLFKNSPELRSMGYWSDGKKMKGLIVTDRP